MNNDLIKRGAVCDMLHDEMGAWGNCADEIEALLKANDALFKIPAVDAVAVVRCSLCDYHMVYKEKDGNGSHLECTKPWGLRGALAPNDFCSYGERKDGADG